ncbi:type IV pilus biogenesis/stability protein PilW [Candidatus Berkiella aquae]|uniref:Tetratricopeptide repeat protein n=1 Tax=Candidatus Berkiella aquae TaxID=295108 RepID=A0A0Q9YNL8_9GAMM|nr:type IV pilus biogenesis/stability protein PilW [Candidatus Berkiella aquae]MCS5711039.1 type IV pilus biogenesis/stability protein PilW [Candidatus Berkiella aquae]
MNHGKGFVIAAICLLAACSTTDEKTLAENSQTPPSMYDLPETVDYIKAAKLNVELGLNYLKQEQIARAKAKFLRAKTLAPNLPEVHYSYGYFLEYVGEIEAAEKAYQKAVSLNSKGGNEHNNYGTFLCRQHHYRKAEKEFLKAIDDPNYANTAEALENAGVCVNQIPDVAKATEYFEKALRYDQNRATALLELAMIRYQERQYAQAKEYHQRYAQIAKPNARFLLLGIELAKRSGDKDKIASYQLLLNKQFPEAVGTKLDPNAKLSSQFSTNLSLT